MPTRKRFLLVLLAFALVLPVASQEAAKQDKAPKTEGVQAEQPVNRNVHFGLPAPAGKDREAFLIERPQYALSYNAKTKCPNWVSWRLVKDDIGKAARGPFAPDPLLPQNIAKVTSHVYDGSGFDRGHQCPAQDRSSTQADMDATFYTTNIVPQAPNCNQRAWERLEHYCRELTKQHNHVLWISCGPAGQGGEGKEGKKDLIGKGRIEVQVPAKLWKVILVLPDEEAKPTKQTRTIAVIMPNDQSVDYDWAKHRVSVAEVEKLTGFTFWPLLPEEVAKELKAKVDEVKVREPKTK